MPVSCFVFEILIFPPSSKELKYQSWGIKTVILIITLKTHKGGNYKLVLSGAWIVVGFVLLIIYLPNENQVWH